MPQVIMLILCQRSNINKSNFLFHGDEINYHKGYSSAAFDIGMTRAQKNQECEWEENEQCVRSNNISKKNSILQFVAAELELTSDQLIHQTERFAYFDNKK